MRDLRDNRLSAPIRWSAFFCGAALCLAAGEAAAQQTQQQPIRLVPGAPAQNPAPPQPAQAQQQQTAPATAGSGKTLAPRFGAQGGIQVDVISTPHAGLGGLLSQRDGAFPPGMWAGTPYPIARYLIDQIPAGTRSLPLANLTRRLLLSLANPPQGAPGLGALLGARIRKLYEAGFLEDAMALAERAPNRGGDDDLQYVLASSNLLGDNVEESCRTANEMRLKSKASYWIKLRAYCYVVEGAVPAAQLTSNLLRERNDRLPLFFELMGKLTNQPSLMSDNPWLTLIDPLDYVMAQRAQVPLPIQAYQNLLPPVRRTVVSQQLGQTKDPAQIEAILALAMQNVHTGSTHGSRLAQVFAQVPFSPVDFNDPFTKVRDLPMGRAQALLYQVTLRLQSQAAAADVIVQALQLAKGTEAYIPIVQLYGSKLRQIALGPDLATSAYLLGEASLYAGHGDIAYRWYQVLAQANPNDEKVRRLGAMILIGAPGLSVRWDAGVAQNWIARANAGQLSQVRLSRELQLMFALGYPLPESAELWLLNAGRGPALAMPSGAVLRRLEEASRAKRLAESVALILIGLGVDGPAATDTYAVTQAVSALSRLNLRQEAHWLALEALALSEQ